MQVIEVLQNAFNADPNAMHALICNRVPCNESLANDEFVVVEKSQVIENEYFQAGALGLINGILSANKLPIVAVKFSEKDENGRSKVLGFCEYDNVQTFNNEN